MSHGARLFDAHKSPIVVLSGGSGPAVSTSSEAEVMQMFIRDLGVPDAAFLLETRSPKTHENARFSAALVRKYDIHEILLVASPLHTWHAPACI